jgi:hypothetical protein
MFDDLKKTFPGETAAHMTFETAVNTRNKLGNQPPRLRHDALLTPSPTAYRNHTHAHHKLPPTSVAPSGTYVVRLPCSEGRKSQNTRAAALCTLRVAHAPSLGTHRGSSARASVGCVRCKSGRAKLGVDLVRGQESVRLGTPAQSLQQRRHVARHLLCCLLSLRRGVQDLEASGEGAHERTFS